MFVSDARVTKLLSTGGWRLNFDSAWGGDTSGGNRNPLEDCFVKTEVKNPLESYGHLVAFRFGDSSGWDGGIGMHLIFQKTDRSNVMFKGGNNAVKNWTMRKENERSDKEREEK